VSSATVAGTAAAPVECRCDRTALLTLLDDDASRVRGAQRRPPDRGLGVAAVTLPFVLIVATGLVGAIGLVLALGLGRRSRR
jgi:hypothetical protein